jgi:hypothetical protein
MMWYVTGWYDVIRGWYDVIRGWYDVIRGWLIWCDTGLICDTLLIWRDTWLTDMTWYVADRYDVIRGWLIWRDTWLTDMTWYVADWYDVIRGWLPLDRKKLLHVLVTENKTPGPRPNIILQRDKISASGSFNLVHKTEDSRTKFPAMHYRTDEITDPSCRNSFVQLNVLWTVHRNTYICRIRANKMHYLLSTLLR